MKKKLQLICVACACLSVLIPCASAGFVMGTSTVDSVMYAMDDGTGTGTTRDYYKYTITVEWDSGVQQAVSHFELDLSSGLLCDYALVSSEGDPTSNIRFEDVTTYWANNTEGVLTEYSYGSGIDGTSTSEGYPDDTAQNVLWYGTTDTGDPENLSVWYEQPVQLDPLDPALTTPFDPGATGLGTFSFYSTFAPQVRTDVDSITLKATNDVTVSGNLTGDLPYCVPEPATMGLLGLGGLALLRKKK